ncbi:CPBP family intramembrane glutamic endopeptidase [Kitasatospora sp. NPDC056138]|uniref:CPBP family intramembrane glutamic endopeptidase n=1 Tax=Kitasatospora sp. NPDC056138 TaxID=3345724 RepID=UPI0035E09063
MHLSLLLAITLASPIVGSMVVFGRMWGLPLGHVTYPLRVSIALVGLWTVYENAKPGTWLYTAWSCLSLLMPALILEPHIRTDDRALAGCVLTYGALITLLASDLAKRHTGHALFNSPPADRPWPTGTAASFAGLWAAAFTSSRLIDYTAAHLPPWIPTPALSQSDATGLHSHLSAVALYANTAVMEELVMVAAVCTLGRRLALPTWALYTLSAGLRVAAHLYLGLAGLPVVILGTASVYLYRRYGRLLPLMAAHFLFDYADTFLL